MSDTQQGPDWWMASDGRWYPPSARPASAPPPPPPAPGAPPAGPPPLAGSAPGSGPGWATPPGATPTAAPTSPPPGFPGAPAAWPTAGVAPTFISGPSRISAGISGTLQGFFWASAAVLLFGGLVTFLARSSFAKLEDGGFEALVDWADQHDAMQSLIALSYLLWIVVFVLLIIWTFKAHRVSAVRSPGKRTWAAGWAIGAWFVPVGNLLLPRLVLGEIDRIAAKPAATAPSATNEPWAIGSPTAQPSSSAAGRGWAWWITMLVGLITAAVGIGLLGSDEELLFDSTEDEILQGYLVQGIGLLVWALSCVLGALYVRKLTRQLNGPR